MQHPQWKEAVSLRVKELEGKDAVEKSPIKHLKKLKQAIWDVQKRWEQMEDQKNTPDKEDEITSTFQMIRAIKKGNLRTSLEILNNAKNTHRKVMETILTQRVDRTERAQKLKDLAVQETKE